MLLLTPLLVVPSLMLAAEGILRTAKAINSAGGHAAVSLKIAEQYVAAFGKLAQKGNTVLLPANVGDPASMVTQALSVFDTLRKAQSARARVQEEDGGDEDAPEGDASDAPAGGAGQHGGVAAGASDADVPFTPRPWEGKL